MTWSRFDDAAAHHPKAVIAGNEAWCLWVAAVMHCNRYLTDGFVSDRALPTLQPRPISPARAHKLARELCEARVTEDGPGLFLRDEARGGYVVHDFLSWNPAKSQVESKREKDRLRKDTERNPDGVRADRARTERGQSADSDRTDDGVHSDSRAPAGVGAPAPDPSPAQPSHTNPEEPPKPPNGVGGGQKQLMLEPVQPPEPDPVSEVFACWQSEMGHPRSKLDSARQRRIKARLSDGFTTVDLCDAIRGGRRAPWLRGQNSSRAIHDGIHCVLRDVEQVEKLRDYFRNEAPPLPAVNNQRGPTGLEDTEQW